MDSLETDDGERIPISRAQAFILDHFLALIAEKGRLPFRSEIQPMDLRDILPWMFESIYSSEKEVIPAIIGTELSTILGPSEMGKNVYKYYNPRDRKLIMDSVENMVSVPCGGYISRLVSSTAGKALNYTVVVLPSTDNNGTVTRFHGAGAFVPVVQQGDEETQHDDNMASDGSPRFQMGFNCLIDLNIPGQRLPVRQFCRRVTTVGLTEIPA